MSEGYPNDIILEHAESIASLKTDVNNLKEKVNDLSDIKEAVVETKTYIKILTKAQEEQSKTLSLINQTIIRQNEKLNDKIDHTDDKVEELKKVFIDDNKKNMIDIREVEKENYLTWIKKNKTPLTVGGVLVALIGFLKYLIDNYETIKKIFLG